MILLVTYSFLQKKEQSSSSQFMILLLKKILKSTTNIYTNTNIHIKFASKGKSVKFNLLLPTFEAVQQYVFCVYCQIQNSVWVTFKT